MPAPFLTGTVGHAAGKSFPIGPSGLRIGRDPGNEVHLDDPGVSRHHARVLLHNGSLWVQDAGSRNGVYVNQARIEQHHQVKAGDVVQVGDHAFRIDVRDDARPAPQPVAPPQPARPVQPAQPAQPAPQARPPQARPPQARPPQPATRPAPEPAFQQPLQLDSTTKRSRTPLIVGGALIVGLVAFIGVVSSGDDTAAPETVQVEAPTEVTQEEIQGRKDISQFLEAAGSNSASNPNIADGATAAQLAAQGDDLYARQGKLREALDAYEMALQLDPTCEICRVRTKELPTRIHTEAQKQLDIGRQYLVSMQYTQAELAFNRVLALVPDDTTKLHLEATDYLEQVRRELSGG